MSRLPYEKWVEAHKERDYIPTYRLLVALHNNTYDEAEKLLRGGIDVDTTPPILDDVTDYYRYNREPNALFDFVLSPRYTAGHSALHHAAATNNTRGVTLLLRYGANIDVRDYIDATPLHVAARHGHLELLHLLLHRGADATAKDCGGWTPADYLRHYTRTRTRSARSTS